jgi:hypothetical protein
MTSLVRGRPLGPFVTALIIMQDQSSLAFIPKKVEHWPSSSIFIRGHPGLYSPGIKSIPAQSGLQTNQQTVGKVQIYERQAKHSP